MTTLKERLQTDFITHYKNKNKMETMTLRQINSAIATAEKAGKSAKTFSDDDVTKLITQEIKKRTKTAEVYREAGENERADTETAEAEFLSTYLPKQLSEDEVTAIVDTVLAEVGTDANMGLIMKNVMSQVKGKADGALVKKIVTERTSG